MPLLIKGPNFSWAFLVKITLLLLPKVKKLLAILKAAEDSTVSCCGKIVIMQNNLIGH